jgi:hypothetical protein
MLSLGRFIDGNTNRRCECEQEGFDRAPGLAEGEELICGTVFGASGVRPADFRGPTPSVADARRISDSAYCGRRAVEWETTPAESAGDTVFTWIGGSQVRPVRPAFPYVTATLSVNGVARLRFPLGWVGTSGGAYTTGVNGFALGFESRRLVPLVESAHRFWESHDVSGFYRLLVPAAHVRAGERLCLRVELDDPPTDTASFFYVSARRDALRVELATLRDEVAQLQSDLIQVRLSHQMLYAHVYPELFPKRVRGERVIVHQDELRHYHPAALTVLRSGEVIVTAREATDHLAIDGRIVAFRSKDGGRSWGLKELLFDLGRSDHRGSPVFELPDGEWLTTDYRCAGEYNASDVWDIPAMTEPTLWGAWSRDQGKTWQFTEEPLTVPGMHPYAEVERHMIRLPSGRLLVAANYMPLAEDGLHPQPHAYQIAVFCSDDNGRHWHVLAKAPDHPFIVGECTLLLTRGGRLLMLGRSQPVSGTDYVERGAVLQAVSLDEGRTWSQFEPTAMSSMASPAHLLQLADGRILCTHASRSYPGSIYATVSRDEGRTWDTDNTRILTMDLQNVDSCYPNSGQLADGTILTTWYSNLFAKFYITVLRFRPEEL